MTKEEKLERLATANKVIEIIAGHGRKFFSTYTEGRSSKLDPERVSHFSIQNGKIWFIDKYSQKAIYVAYRRGRWRHFSEGGTLRDLVLALYDWIRGDPEGFQFHRFGPWPSWVCGDGDLWGYGLEEMAIVREKVKQLIEEKR